MGLELGRIRHSLPNVGGVGIELKTRRSPPWGGWTGLEKLRHSPPCGGGMGTDVARCFPPWCGWTGLEKLRCSPPCGRGMGTDVDVVGLNVKSLNTKRKGNSFSG